MSKINSSLPNNNNLATLKALWSLVVSDILKVRGVPSNYDKFFLPMNKDGLIKYTPMAGNCLRYAVSPVTLYIGTTTEPTYTEYTSNTYSGVGSVTIYINYAGNPRQLFQSSSSTDLFAAGTVFAPAYLSAVASIQSTRAPTSVNQPDFFMECGLNWLYGYSSDYEDSLFFDHPIWGRDNVVMIVNFECRDTGYVNDLGQNYGEDIYGLGQSFGDKMNLVQARFQESWPGKNIRWAVNAATLGQSVGHSTPTVWADGAEPWNYNTNDLMLSTAAGTSVPGPWAANGLENWNISIDFYLGLKNRLDAHNVPYPEYVMNDYETPPNAVGNTYFGAGNTGHQNYLDIIADARYDTELFDGNQTLKQLLDGYTDLAGGSVNRALTGANSEMFLAAPSVVTARAALLRNLQDSIQLMVNDWAAHTLHFVPAKYAFGDNVICMNYNGYTANRNYQTWNYRPRETPVDFNSGMHADANHITISGGGISRMDALSANPGQAYDLGLADYYELIHTYGIPATSGSYSSISQHQDLGLAIYESTARNLIKSRASGKKSCIWQTWSSVGTAGYVSGQEGLISKDSTLWPSGVSLPLTVSFQLEVFKRFAKVAQEGNGAIDIVHCFEALPPAVLNGNVTPNWAGPFDFWESVISHLPVVGFASA